MGIAAWCVVIAGLMPYVWTVVAKRSGQRYDNRHPRAWQQALDGSTARVHAAHLNAFEAFPLFAVAVIFALLSGADRTLVDVLAVAFILVRIGHGFAYIADRSRLRSLLWFIGFACVLALFAAAAIATPGVWA